MLVNKVSVKIMIEMSNLQILTGDSLAVLPTLAAESVQCCVTSPPYWGLRDYDHSAQIGAEPSPEIYVENLVAMFREVRRVLRRDGTVWLNVGDGYARNGGTGNRKIFSVPAAVRLNGRGEFVSCETRTATRFFLTKTEQT